MCRYHLQLQPFATVPSLAPCLTSCLAEENHDMQLFLSLACRPVLGGVVSAVVQGCGEMQAASCATECILVVHVSSTLLACPMCNSIMNKGDQGLCHLQDSMAWEFLAGTSSHHMDSQGAANYPDTQDPFVPGGSERGPLEVRGSQAWPGTQASQGPDPLLGDPQPGQVPFHQLLHLGMPLQPCCSNCALRACCCCCTLRLL